MHLVSIKTVVVKVLMGLLSMLPLGFLRVLGKCAGWLNFCLNTQSSKITRANIALCLPHLSDQERYKLARSALMHTGQAAFETPAVWLSSLSRSQSWITRVEGEDLLAEAVKAGQGVVVLLPHLGNWEVFNIYFATRGKAMALYHPPKQEFMKPIMEKIRERLGNELVATNVKGLARLYKGLAQGKTTVILPDQVPASGKFAPFFGEPAFTDQLVSRLIKKTGARAVCCVVYREGPGFVVQFSAVDERLYDKNIEESLVGLNLSVEQCISGHLEQYQWQYKRYRKRPAGKKKLYEFRPGADFYHE